MFLWVQVDTNADNAPEAGTDLFPFIFMSGAAFPATLLPVLPLGFELMYASLVIASFVFCGLGTIVGFLWRSHSWVLGLLGGIPSILFVLALHDWSFISPFRVSIGGIPMVSLPITCWLLGSLGTRVGSFIAHHVENKLDFKGFR